MAYKGLTIKELFTEIEAGQKKAFDQVYLLHFDNLKQFAIQYIKNEESAEEIVSEIFVKLWVRRADLSNIHEPIFYLYKSVKNACFTYLKREEKYLKVALDEITLNESQYTMIADPEKILEYKELLSYLDEVVDSLPDQRKAIFKMVKEDRLKCKEVAELLDISVRTVENQVYNAIKVLNEKVEKYLNEGNLPNGSPRRTFFMVWLINITQVMLPYFLLLLL
ncbi:RNA polymerase sigma-70 factor [Parapedobacter tibetensis]|uniref:RNA polymerase sigma-70 factor n=1 Tax=Parapedobacter tibetensis TaxID=2972951 RepID=UPI00214D2A7F|nr:RNA polymerase sigma-70 factor [Parapedobacter tibetensis]